MHRLGRKIGSAQHVALVLLKHYAYSTNFAALQLISHVMNSVRRFCAPILTLISFDRFARPHIMCLNKRFVIY